jgi:hypothetical protein
VPVPADQRETLLRYLRVQRVTDREIAALLRRAARDLAVQIENLAPTSFSDSVRLTQLRLRQRTIAQELWTQTGQSITTGKGRATQAALQAGDIDIGKLLKRLDRATRALLQDGAEKAAREAVGRAVARFGGRGAVLLSERVYKNQQLMTGQVDRLISSALARGLSPSELAREARKFISPTVPGGPSYSAMRLGRTEVNNSFHAASAAYYEGNPFVEGMKWNLSSSHPRSDVCNDYAGEDHDRLGAGVFRTENVPPKPHPQCFCYVVPVSASDDDIVAAFTRGDYNDFLAGQGISATGVRQLAT